MKLTITREQLQEGLVAVAASVPAKTTLPILSNILLEATKEGIRHFGQHHSLGVGRSGGRHHAAGPEAGRDRS
jgi:DNA polymerase-3 subunit beta